jgi:hypothetical protein
MPLFPPQDFRSTEQTHRSGLAADRPNAADVLVGTLYFSTDTNVLERSNGVTWDNYSAGGGVGPPGPTGAQGGAGAPGLDGQQGEAGEFYPIPGPAGSVGATGPTGPTGPVGFSGFDGEDGADGPPGPAGITGPAGAAGVAGIAGPPGLDGLEGEQGEQGLPGIIGPTGAAGATGPVGLPGIPGLDGEDGPEPYIIAGPQGIQGEPGFTATQIILTDFTQDLGEAERSGTFNVTGLSGLTVGENVLVVQTKQAIASKGNATDEPEMDLIRATGIVISATTFAVSWLCESVVVGTYAFAYAFGGAIATLPSVVQGDILYGSAPDTIVTLAKDTNASRYLSNQGASNNPQWDRVSLTDGVVGTLPAANLPADVAYLNTVNIFTEGQIFRNAGAAFLILGYLSGTLNEQYSMLDNAAGDLSFIYLNDDFSFQSLPWTVQRSTLNHQIRDSLEVINGGISSTTGYRELSRSVNLGDWQAVTFNAANFSGINLMTWTVGVGNVLVNRYMLIGHTLFWNISVGGVVGGAVDTNLFIAIPGGFLAGAYSDHPLSYVEDNSILTDGFVFANVAGVSFVSIGLVSLGNWTAGNAYVEFNIALEIQ